MSWDKAKAAKDGRGGRFIKLKDGQEVLGVFMGEPHIYYSVWGDSERTEYPEWAEGRSFKFKINFLVKENDIWIAKILQGGSMVMDEILSHKEEYGLDGFIYKIKRKGSGKEDTAYKVFPKEKLDAKTIALLKKVPLNKLAADDDDFEFPPKDEDEEQIKKPSDRIPDFDSEEDLDF